MTELFDVEAVNIKTKVRRKIAEKASKSDAEAVIRLAILRRGINQEFYEMVHSLAEDRP